MAMNNESDREFLQSLERVRREVGRYQQLIETLKARSIGCLQLVSPYLESFAEFSRDDSNDNLAKIISEYDRLRRVITLYNSVLQWVKSINAQTSQFAQMEYIPLMDPDMIMTRTTSENQSLRNLPFRKRFRTQELPEEMPAKMSNRCSCCGMPGRRVTTCGLTSQHACRNPDICRNKMT